MVSVLAWPPVPPALAVVRRPIPDGLFPSLDPRYRASSLLRNSPPLHAPATVLCSSRIWPLGGLPLAPESAIGLLARSLGVAASHVPRRRLNRARAAYTPDATWAASRFLPGLSRVDLHSQL